MIKFNMKNVAYFLVAKITLLEQQYIHLKLLTTFGKYNESHATEWKPFIQ